MGDDEAAGERIARRLATSHISRMFTIREARPDDATALVGFMGLSGNSLEAMFLDPAHLRAGHGRRLVAHARGLKGALTLQ